MAYELTSIEEIREVRDMLEKAAGKMSVVVTLMEKGGFDDILARISGLRLFSERALNRAEHTAVEIEEAIYARRAGIEDSETQRAKKREMMRKLRAEQATATKKKGK